MSVLKHTHIHASMWRKDCGGMSVGWIMHLSWMDGWMLPTLEPTRRQTLGAMRPMRRSTKDRICVMHGCDCVHEEG